MRTQEFVELKTNMERITINRGDVVIGRAEGVWVYDVEGRDTSIAWRRIPR